MAAALAIVTLAAFQGLGRSSFIVFDDAGYVVGNRHVEAGLGARSVAWAFTTDAQANWHPLTWLSHMLDVSLFGLDAGKHHLTSLVLHVLNAELLLLVMVGMTGALWRSALVALLFAIHPLHVESVAWIAERKDVLSTLFWLLTLLAWLRWLEAKTVGRYALVLALYALGLMAKPMLTTLPFTLVLLDVWPLKRAPSLPRSLSWPLLREKAPLFAMSAASCVVTFAVQSGVGAVQTLQRITLSERIANALLAYVWYLGKTFVPTSLAVFYPYPERLSLVSWAVLGSAILLAAITVVALRTVRVAPFLATGTFWFLGTLVPVIGFVQVGGQARADRYAYVPIVGLFVAIAWGLGELATRSHRAKVAVVGVASAFVLVLFFVTRVQVGYWSGDVPLFRHALAVTSGNWLAHNNLGRAHFAQGRVDEAVREYEEALRISPGYADARYNLGLAFAQSGRTSEAIEQYEQALRLEPRFPAARNNLGAVLADTGRTEAAIEQYQLAIGLDPDNAEAPYNLGNALYAAGRIDDAIAQYQRSIMLNPRRAEARNNLGNALVHARRYAEAIEQYEQALRIDPGFVNARDNLRLVREAVRLP